MTIDDLKPAPFGVADITAARQRIAGFAYQTPLLTNPELDRLTGAKVFIKCENLQRTGSFKFRGAYNALACLSAQERARGIVAVSSGNHAQGVAEAARLFGVQATIVMPADAPATKSARVKRSVATIVTYDRASEDRDAIAQTLVAKTGGVFVRPYDDYRVMAGQGTVGLETIDVMNRLSLVPDTGLICCGGGGLSAGVSTAWRNAFEAMDIVTVEPEGFDDTRRSLESGQREQANAPAPSICDALMAPKPGTLTFPINQGNGVRGVAVTDDEVLAAVAFAFHEVKTVVEPGGAVCLAALLNGKVDVQGQTVLAIISGGNIDPAMMQRALSA